MKASRTILLGCAPISGKMHSALSLVLRLMAAGAMLTHGIAKLLNFTNLSQTFSDPLGVGHSTSLLMVVMAEVGCSILLALGLLTRLALLALVFNMVVAFAVSGGFVTFGSGEMAFMYLALYVAIFAVGAGRYSLDRVIFS